ncbi:ATPase AAA [Moorella thermoacetica]|uniref:AAA ATPase n=1 Tax=Moorella thermoacetica (strain ATCC 39073 / JCM 9320) TaxID=264732 RepID=Q2RLR4_MOOTA|nr:ATP-binding protein [Moorella thermoacetica]AKX95676.1 ATP-dependent zinc metalloprotease FtsH 2 [Moorella thermoacetica]OIQ52705.1 ATP-dependent zinc metalloprotease FtsH 2 [Moorella thermoacetica]QCZ99485.1 ATP-dependent zinc metalloprotease FtsH 2 [Moorella thermoacetica]TYL06501.1 ATP-dependent zinc metalloprotease FtsH [Moorella thermoacetica]TYL06504.1 ATP-dependent zinc metalloprotease FtsH [Moorella thermoacetica]
MEHIINILPKLIRASFEGNLQTIEIASMTISRKLKKEYPATADEIAKIIAFHKAGAPMLRAAGHDPLPTDSDTYLSLAKLYEPDILNPKIILDSEVEEVIEQFLKERMFAEKLITLGIRPPTSILLYGPPGVGKTYLSKYIAHKLSMPLIVMDLASSVSSYLGKTGQNLKKIVDYAKNRPSILFLDEFDAVAKRRDDPSDIGELKRIVNVLLKELEDWPIHSIIIAATNHPDLLDKAIWRRFNRTIAIKLPTLKVREKLWQLYLRENELINPSDSFISVVAKVTEGFSPSDINQVAECILRRIIIDGEDLIKGTIHELKSRCDKNAKFNERFIRVTKETLGANVTQAQIAEWLNISVSTVNHHLKKKKGE